MTKKIAIYPGSFDPITIGHEEIIKKAAKIFDEVYVVVCVNPNKIDATFTANERVSLIKEVAKNIKNVKVDKFFGKSIDYATKKKAVAMIRGVRNTKDFDNEITQYHFNHRMNPNIETIIIFPDAESLYVSSSSIKELALINSDFKEYVPKCVYKQIKDKLCNKKAR